MSSKNRKIGLKNRGDNNGMSKLTEKDVILIKKSLLKPYPGQIMDLSKQFNTSHSIISMIKSKKRWKHVQIKGNTNFSTLDNIYTEFGVARIDFNGYYQITSPKYKKYKSKRPHQLIWEKFYKMGVPEGYIIHHVNRNKLYNLIQNLQCVEDKIHRKYHGKQRSDHEIDEKLLWVYSISGLSFRHIGIIFNIPTSTVHYRVEKYLKEI